MKGLNGKGILKNAVIIGCWIAVWHLIAVLTDNPILLATPWQVVCRLGQLVITAVFWQSVLGSLVRIAIGFVLGCLAGIFLAVAAGKYSLLEDVVRPVITLLKAVPVASFVVILLIWWGSDNLAVSVCFLIVFPNLYLNTLEGLRSTDVKLLEVAEVFGMPYATRFFYVYRPALKPFLTGALKLALGLCWKSGVAAEVIGTPACSLGEQMYFAKIYLDTAGVFAWTAVIVLLCVLFEKTILKAADLFFAWQPACRKASCDRMPAVQNGAKVLHLQGISKQFGGKILWNHYDAEFTADKTYYFTEASGSGKTTLFRMICGLEQPDEGYVKPVPDCAVMFQEDRLCEEYSALKNVEMVTGDAVSAEQALLQLLDAEDIRKPCSQLSGGMKRRVALVRAMESEADCVLLDEPFTGMDESTRERAGRYIAERGRERILLIATHIQAQSL